MTFTKACALLAIAAGWLAAGVAAAPAHQGHHGHAGGQDRPELSLPASADFDYQPPEPGTYRLPPLKAAGDGLVVDETGVRHSLLSLVTGQVTVLSFIYTRCGDVCPLATMVLADLHDVTAQDPRIRDHVRLLTLSFDPEHDTPDVMAIQARALRNPSGADWRFLTTPGQDQLRPILAAYGQLVAPKADPGDSTGPLAHQLRVYLLDRQGWIRNIYSLDFLDPRLVMTDVRTLLMEVAAEARR